jgi:hypothetical protein
MTPVFERAKTVHALDRAATVIGIEDIKVFNVSDLSFHTDSFYRRKVLK